MELRGPWESECVCERDQDTFWPGIPHSVLRHCPNNPGFDNFFVSKPPRDMFKVYMTRFSGPKYPFVIKWKLFCQQKYPIMTFSIDACFSFYILDLYLHILFDGMTSTNSVWRRTWLMILQESKARHVVMRYTQNLWNGLTYLLY